MTETVPTVRELDREGRPAEDARREATFEEICEHAVPKLYAFLRSQVGSRELAKELVGRVFLKSCERWAGQRCGELTVMWMFRTARTTLIDYWRVDGRRERVSLPLDELKGPASLAANPEQAYAAKERQAQLVQAMSDLDESERLLLALKFAGQRTNRQIAGILGLSEGAVSMRLLRALRRLRERLGRMGVA